MTATASPPEMLASRTAQGRVIDRLSSLPWWLLLILFAVVVFLVGLVSEQISSLRFEGRQ